MLKRRYLSFAIAIALLSGCTSNLPLVQNERQMPQVVAAATTWSNEDYGRVLRTYVNTEGLVNYAALQANPQTLRNVVVSLAALAPSTYAAWGDAEKISFLINAYNALTLNAIIEQQPLKGSIKDIWGVWNFKKHTLMGQSVTLDTIEHEMLRKEFQEPRIHAALVCAAISCPPLRQDPYMGDSLNQQLDDQVRKWLSSAHGLTIDRAQNQVSISSIFDWFGEDWQAQYTVAGTFAGSAKERAALNFISNYVSPEDKEYLVQGRYKLDYLTYDWSLNRQ